MVNPSSSSSSASLQQQQVRLAQLEQEKAQLEAEIQVQQYAANYEITLEYPARIENNKRTDSQFIQHRLMDAGLFYDIPVTVQDSLQATSRFVEQLQATGCFNAVQVQLGTSKSEPKSDATHANNETIHPRTINVKLDEANWYSLKAGGGIRGSQTGFMAADSSAFVPHAEVALGLRNLAGVCDTTKLQYTLDTHNIPTYSLIHSRPLYTVLPFGLGDVLLEQVRGSLYDFTAIGQIETQDFQSTRSYQEFQRYFKLRASSSANPNDVSQPYQSALSWTLLHRDIIPRRHAKLPFSFDASPEVVSQAWPSVKHSLQWESSVRLTNHPMQPTEGLQYIVKTEVALPPGDIGFMKATGSMSIHKPVIGDTLCFHAALSTGYLHNLRFGGLTRPATISDRFFVGGPMQLRGFSQSGIGPRAKTLANGPGDALGGDFYYTATLMASFSNASLATVNTRLFGFCNVGTCVGNVMQLSPLQVASSSRASVGLGLSTCMFGPRLELTYAWPIRSGPRDVTRQFQFGMGFTFS
jgi:outer membrane protein assembly factor BamA